MNRPELSDNELDRLMAKIREEIVEQDARAELASSSPARGGSQEPATDRSDDAGRYRLKRFLRLEAEDFVVAAYQAILKRPPSPAELSLRLDELRRGHRRKADILVDLRYGPEGRKHRVAVKGLTTRRLSAGILRIPVVGHVVRFAGGLAKLPRIAKDVQRIRREVDGLRTSVDRVPDDVDARLAILSREIAPLRPALSGAIDRTHGMATQIEGLSRRLDQLAPGNAPLGVRLDEILQRLAVLQRLQIQPAPPLGSAADARDLSSVDTQPAPADAAAENSRAALYAAFEDCFRGTRADIKGRQTAHLGLVTQQDERLRQLPVIDVGCGRGEWLELLAENGIGAVGVDLNRVFLEENRARGLDVVESDALAYLRAQATGSARAVTGFHIIEHLPFDAVLLLLDESLRVLADDGLALFETPNPENLVTAAHKFYYDPTHRHPIPPEVAAFLLRARGFRNVTILRLHENRDPARDQVPDGVLRALLFGPQDYAVVGYR